jgi:uncharacterized protein (DUF58 family)
MLRRAPVGVDGLARIGARQVYILPTRFGLVYATTVFVMLMGSLNYQNNLGLLFAFFLAAVGLVAMHHCWYNLLGLAVTVRPGPACFAGGVAGFEVTLRNERRTPRYDLRLGDTQEGIIAIWLGGGDQKTLTLSRGAHRRGLLHLGSIEVATRHPMHLFRAWSYADTTACALVYPRPALQAPPPAYSAGTARRPARGGTEGTDDYVGSRAWRTGDSPRHLDWKVLARERGLFVKQFGGDAGLDVWIDWNLLDTADPEGRISLMTRQVLDVAESGMRFGLRLPARAIALGRGQAHLHECLTALALFDDG